MSGEPLRPDRIVRNKPADLTRQETLFFDAVETLLPACKLSYLRMQTAGLMYQEIAASAAAQAPQGDELVRARSTPTLCPSSAEFSGYGSWSAGCAEIHS